MKSLPKETRGEIVSLLKKSNGMTASEIATELDLHSMTVRQHLAVLERDSYIQHNREKIGRGRPTYVYRLAEEAKRLFPSNYPRFTMGILDALVMMDGAEKVDQLLAYDMEAKISTHFKNIENKSLGQRAAMLGDYWSEERYVVEVEETPTAFIMKEHNCALGSVVEKYNQLCQQELSLFERLLSVPVERQCHMATGDHLCSYKISKVDNA